MAISVNYIDIFFAVLVLTMLAAGYARGLLLSVLTLLRSIIVFPLAFFTAGYFNQQIYDGFVRETAVNKVSQSVNASLNIDEFVSNARETVASLPFGLANSVDLSFLNGVTNENIAQRVVDNIVEPVAIAVIKALLFILTALLFFIITAVIIHLIKKAEDKKDSSPLKQTNKLLGAAFGFVKALVITLVLCAVFSYLGNSLLSENNSFKQMLDVSLVVQNINKINPLLNWF